MATEDSRNGASGQNASPLAEITAVAEELSAFLSPRKNRKAPLQPCLKYVERIANIAISADYVGLYEFCALYQERLLAVDKRGTEINDELHNALESWPRIIVDLNTQDCTRSREKLIAHLNLPCWGLPIPENDLDLLRTMLKLPDEGQTENVDNQGTPPATTQHQEKQAPYDNVPDDVPDLPEEVQELITILTEEFRELSPYLQKVIELTSRADADAETDSYALKDYAELLSNYIDAAHSIGFSALARVCEHIQSNIFMVSDEKRFLRAQEASLLEKWSICVNEHLQEITNRDHASALAMLLTDKNWPQSLDKEAATALSAALRTPDLTEVVEETAREVPAARPEDVIIDIPEDVDQDLLDALLQELPEQAEELSEEIQKLATGALDSINNAQRIAHTIKGAGNTVGIPGIGNIAHRLEDILLGLIKREAPPPSPLAEVMLDATNCLEGIVATLMGMDEPPDNALEVLNSIIAWIEKIERGDISEPQEGEGKESATQRLNGARPEEQKDKTDSQQRTGGAAEQVLRVPAPLIDKLVRTARQELIFTNHAQEQVHDILRDNQKMREKYDLLQNIGGKLEELIDVKDMGAVSGGQRDSGYFDSMEMDQYSELHTNVRQLVEAAVDIYEMEKIFAEQLARLNEVIIAQKKLSLIIQEAASETRMLPAKSIFSRLKRIARQSGNATGKKIALELNGGETLMSGDMLSNLTEPLMHILRNAIDHGIESPEIRAEIGKPEEGSVTIEFRHQAQEISVSVEDDGAGLDFGRIREIAIAKEMIEPDEVVSEDTLSKLIFKLNFSTRTEATQVSGRGIGMNVASININKMGGSLNVSSDVGRGCRMEMSLPISMAETRILLVRCSNRKLAITINAVQRIIPADDCELVEKDDQRILQATDGAYPVSLLSTLLNIPDRRAENRSSRPALILSHQDQDRAFLIDDILDSSDQVVNDLGKYIPKLPGLLGVTILGDGSIIPVIDLIELLYESEVLKEHAHLESQQGVFHAPIAMVVDDSLSVRRSLTTLMEDSGYVVKAARDGIEATDILEGVKPDILLVDMEMPRMNGIELTAYIRGKEAIADIPIIMITSRSTKKHREEASRAGINSHFTKPFLEDELFKEINRLRTAQQ